MKGWNGAVNKFQPRDTINIFPPRGKHLMKDVLQQGVSSTSGALSVPIWMVRYGPPSRLHGFYTGDDPTSKPVDISSCQLSLELTCMWAAEVIWYKTQLTGCSYLVHWSRHIFWFVIQCHTCFYSLNALLAMPTSFFWCFYLVLQPSYDVFECFWQTAVRHKTMFRLHNQIKAFAHMQYMRNMRNYAIPTASKARAWSWCTWNMIV